MPLATLIDTLREQVDSLPRDWLRLNVFFEAGRVDVMTCQTALDAAQEALDVGNEARAALLLLRHKQHGHVRSQCHCQPVTCAS